jgi:hypothetical protein
LLHVFSGKQNDVPILETQKLLRPHEPVNNLLDRLSLGHVWPHLVRHVAAARRDSLLERLERVLAGRCAVGRSVLAHNHLPIKDVDGSYQILHVTGDVLGERHAALQRHRRRNLAGREVPERPGRCGNPCQYHKGSDEGAKEACHWR